ncbi:MAG: hypothetical protein GAK31_03558 [Stenotrophomonas maltophilia]|uniref:Uncharacterized protein n=1 Tax=Stenotrophomonas maltophilia TaxID=40324 RepID=A0A7V8FDT4_STEMA|nr:MAG: hypothetical protein GAK31_03558 [Stenotrophomonas maltophilia]
MQVVALSVLDPANPFGSLLAWPTHAAGQRPLRRAGAFVVIGDGRPLLYLAQGGRSLLSWLQDSDRATPALLAAAAQALARALRGGRRLSFTLERIDEAPVARGALTDALRAAGFSNVPKGLDWLG